jgi:methylmalonyl-CoA epimerase
MKAVLDHVGIAVERLDEALAFYRDALGLDVEVPEEVPTQKVRAHMIDTGAAALELLEATAPESPIAASSGRRGPGLHHVTLRLDDLRAALAHLGARGRTPGGHGPASRCARVARRVHPSVSRPRRAGGS